MRTREKLAWALAAAFGLIVAAGLAGTVFGGPLDPPGPLGPTMKSLDDIPGSWSRELQSNNGQPPEGGSPGCNSTRFQCIFNDNAVLDHETGLVWSRFSTTSNQSWQSSQCFTEQIGDSQGWRLPSISEIATIAEPGLGDPPYLPDGHPFKFVSATDPYWTSTPYDSLNIRTFFFDGGTGALETASGLARYLCVRAPE